MNIDTPIQTRKKHWETTLQSEAAIEWDVRPWLLRCLASQATFGEKVTGKRASHSMHAEASWPAIALFNELAFYGRYGSIIREIPPQDRADWIANMIDEATRLHSMAPKGLVDDAAVRTLAIAAGRSAIEAAVGEIDPLALGLLGGVTEGRIRNMMSGSEAYFTSHNGRVPIGEALAWLSRRAAYWPSIWGENEKEHASDDSPKIRTPRASDGTVFHPALRRRNGFSLGPKGKEVVVETFGDAIRQLVAMREPRWRRPNSQGNWGIVKATGWEFLTMKELSQMRI
jgi:hypothetical protein